MATFCILKNCKITAFTSFPFGIQRLVVCLKMAVWTSSFSLVALVDVLVDLHHLSPAFNGPQLLMLLLRWDHVTHTNQGVLVVALLGGKSTNQED